MKKSKLSRLLATVTLGVVTATGLCVGASACGHEHNFQWKYDAETGMHWQECTDCDDKSVAVPHEDEKINETGAEGKDNKCDQCGADLTPAPSTVAVTGVTVNATTTEVEVGKTITLTATVTPSNATNKTVTWISSDTTIATVNASTGAVTGAKAGTVTITATAGGVSGTKQITVKAAQQAATPVPATAITISGPDAVTVGKTIQLDADLTPAEATEEVTWESSDKTIATVDENGLVTGKAAGTVYIAAYTDSVSDMKEITVNAPVAVTGITLDATAALTVGESKKLTATVAPDNATDKGINWSSSDSTKVSVDTEGNILGVGEGSATITATAADDSGVTATCTVTVSPAPVAVESVTIQEGASGKLAVGGKVTLHATVTPANATNGTVAWASDTTSVATVDAATGEVTGVASGTAKITATAGDVTAEYTLTVQTKFDELSERSDNLISEDFNNTPDGKLEQFESYGVRGIYSGLGSGSPTAATHYVSVSGGKVVQTSPSGGELLTVVDFGQVTGVIEGIVDVTLSSNSNSQTFMRFIGKDAERDGSEVFGLRTNSGNIQYRIDASSTVLTPTGTVATSTDTMTIYFKIDGNKITIQIGNTVLLSELETTIESIYGLNFASGNGNTNTVTIDNIAINGSELGLEEVKENAKTELNTAYGAYQLSDYTKNGADLTEAKTTGEREIDEATTPAEVAAALSEAKAAMKAVLTDAKITEAQTAAINKLKEDYPAASYTFENLTGADEAYNNKAVYTAAIQQAETDILTANTQEAMDEVIKTATDAIKGKTDGELLADKIEKTKAALADYITAKNLTAESDEAKAVATAQTLQNAEIAKATTITEANDALTTAKAAIDKAIDDLKVSLTELISTAKSDIGSYVTAATTGVESNATYVGLINGVKTDAESKLDAVTEETRNSISQITLDAKSALEFVVTKYEAQKTADAYKAAEAAKVYNDKVKADIQATDFTASFSGATEDTLDDVKSAATAAVDDLVASLENLYLEVSVGDNEVNYIKYGTKLTLSDLHVSGFEVKSAKVNSIAVLATAQDELVIYNNAQATDIVKEDYANFVTSAPYTPVSGATELTNIEDNSLYSLVAVGGADASKAVSVTIGGKSFSSTLTSKNINAIYPKVDSKPDKEHPNEVHDNSATPYIITVKSALKSMTIYNALSDNAGNGIKRWGTIYCTINGVDKVVKTLSSGGDMKNAYTLENVAAGTVIKLWADNQSEMDGARLHIYGIEAEADLNKIDKTVTVEWKNGDGSTFTTEQYHYFDTITPPAGSPTVEGTFNGWQYNGAALAANLKLASSDTAYVMTPDVSASNAYITFKLNAEDTGDKKGYTVGETGGVAADKIGVANPKEAGKLFLGWYLDGAETAYDFTTLAIDGDVTVIAKFMEPNVTITYGAGDSDKLFFLDGTLYDEDKVAVTALRPDPETGAEGQEFKGWVYMDGDKEVELLVKDIVANTYVVTAKYGEPDLVNVLDTIPVSTTQIASGSKFIDNDDLSISLSNSSLKSNLTSSVTVDDITFSNAIISNSNGNKVFTITAKKAITVTVYYCTTTNGAVFTSVATASVAGEQIGNTNVYKTTATLEAGGTLTITGVSSCRVTLLGVYVS